MQLESKWMVSQVFEVQTFMWETQVDFLIPQLAWIQPGAGSDVATI